jgi:hypothetical protein
MTNPGRISQLRLPSDTSPENITAVSYVPPAKPGQNGFFWFGTNSGDISVAREPPGQSTALSFEARYAAPVRNQQVRTLLAIDSPPAVLGHWSGRGGQPGPVELIFPGGVRQAIEGKASEVAVANRAGLPSRVGFVFEATIRIFEFFGNTLQEVVTHKAEAPVVGFALAGDSFVYGANKKYTLFNIDNKKQIPLKASPTDNLAVGVLGSGNYVLVYREFLLRVDWQGNEKEPVISVEVARGKMEKLLPDKNAIYRFYAGQFTRTVVEGADDPEPLVFDVSKVSAAVKALDRLLVVEPTAVRLVGSLPPTSELVQQWKNSQQEKVLALLATLSKDVAADLALSVFSELWNSGEINGALELAGQQTIGGQVVSIIGLMPLLSTGTTAPALPLQKRDIKPNDPFVIDSITDFLKGARERIISDPLSKRRQELPAINVAYAEALALNTKSPPTRELDQVILDGNIDLDVLIKWLQDHSTLPLGPAVAVVQSHRNVPEALRILRELHARSPNPLFVSEAAIALQRLKEANPDVFSGHLDWLLANDSKKPQQALVAILSPYHDDALVIRWLERNGLAAHRLRYYCYLLTHKASGGARGARIANPTLLDLLALISELTKDGFNISSIDFTEAAASKKFKGQALLDEAKKELSRLVLEILQEQAENLDFEAVLAQINKSPDSYDKTILLTVYRVAQRYPEALRLMLDDPNLSPEELTNFLRTAPKPKAAFSAFFGEVAPSDLFSKHGAFISENLQYLDIGELLRIIPPDSKITQVRKTVQAAVLLLLQRNASLDTQIAITKALITDAEARNARLKASYCTITATSTCAGCGKELGAQLVYMEPGTRDGKLYHHGCRPVLQ